MIGLALMLLIVSSINKWYIFFFYLATFVSICFLIDIEAHGGFAELVMIMRFSSSFAFDYINPVTCIKITCY